MDNEIVKCLLVFAGMVVIMFAVLALIDRQQCYAKWSDDFEPQWGFFSNCMIKAEGKRIPSENYREF